MRRLRQQQSPAETHRKRLDSRGGGTLLNRSEKIRYGGAINEASLPQKPRGSNQHFWGAEIALSSDTLQTSQTCYKRSLSVSKTMAIEVGSRDAGIDHASTLNEVSSR